MYSWTPTLRDSDSSGLEWNRLVCISYGFPGDVDAAGAETTLRDQWCRRPGEWNREGCSVHSRVDLVVSNNLRWHWLSASSPLRCLTARARGSRWADLEYKRNP